MHACTLITVCVLRIFIAMCLSKKVLLSAIPPVRFRSFLWTMSVDYSCGEYGKEVTDDDKAIQCESDCMR